MGLAIATISIQECVVGIQEASLCRDVYSMLASISDVCIRNIDP